MFSRLLAMFLTLYFTTYLSWPDWLYFYCLFTFKCFDSFDHYVACCVPLRERGDLELAFKVVPEPYPE